MNLGHIVKNPIITEKSTIQKEAGNRYVFKVNMKATKDSVAEAVESIFGVDVIDVKTAIMPGKKRRILRTQRFTKTPRWKKAVVQVKDGQEIKYD
jgi:large subunit ribosomal protein L23